MKSTHLFLLLSILVSVPIFEYYPFPAKIISATALSLDTDKEALISFKSRISSFQYYWDNDSSSPCNWTGITCNGRNGGQRVIGIDLSGLSLTGSIDPHVGNLSFLRSLQLQDNLFTGPIPVEICSLFRLRVVNMSSNAIEGSLPSNISRLTELQVLDLMSNRITGIVPQDLTLLTKLQVLKLGRNQFYGEIPPSIGNISSLTTVNFGTNSLGGRIPSELSRLRNLEHLDLTLNNLSGLVPPNLYNMSSLVSLALASNNLWGEIPSDVGHRLPNLLVFNFCLNRFTGKIPGSLHNLTNIEIIRMASNFLEGTVPPGLGNLPFLHMYNIGFNKIVNDPSDQNGLSFITSLTNSSRLNFLAIDGNRLNGTIPDSIGNLSKSLSFLYMGGNQIYGSIPASIAHLSSLALLNLSYNSISGEIPSQIGLLEQLRVLNLAGNQLSGSIPSTLGNLQELTKIDLSGNRLSGTIPTSFGKLQNLIYMDLSNNKLHGRIPRETLQLPGLSIILNLSRNFLEGPLPDELGQLETLITIDLSTNKFSGRIPQSIGRCKSLEKVSMATNELSGPIPNSIGELRGLEILDLSSNQLSGSIPDALQNLQALKNLNLSFNNLEGVVPKGGVFENSSDIHLEGNPKLCLHLPCLRSTGSRSKVVIIAAIVAISALSCVILVLVLFHKIRRNKFPKAAIESSEFLKVQQHQMVSYDELREATGNFSQENMIGRGSFGSVYKVYLTKLGINAIAVKVLDNERTHFLKSFLAECEALRNVRHRNLVRLVTACSSIDFKNNKFLALVYEYLSNGNLNEWVKGNRKHEDGNPLDVLGRLNVAIDVASALDYLHHGCDVPIVHCDLKPSNILLDQDMTAKIGDFGLARLLMGSHTGYSFSISADVLNGSIGYIPPEYGMGREPSTAGDVYSFGITLLELFTGKSPTEEYFNEGRNLIDWVQSAYPDDSVRVLDPELIRVFDDRTVNNKQVEYCMKVISEVGLCCTADSPDERISMRHALSKLRNARETLSKSGISYPYLKLYMSYNINII